MKKNLRKILFAATFVFLLTGCGKIEEEESVSAMYIQRGEDFKIFVDVNTGSPFYAPLPEGTPELTTGDMVKIYGNGIMLQSYPGQYPGVTKIVMEKEGQEEDAAVYEELISQVYQEPDPAEPPYLSLLYHTESANVTAAANRGSYRWSYMDENGKEQETISDMAHILDWQELNDIRVTRPLDVTLDFTEKPREVKAFYFSEGEESKETEGEAVAITLEDEKYVLKGLERAGIYQIKAVFSQGEVEYGFKAVRNE